MMVAGLVITSLILMVSCVTQSHDQQPHHPNHQDTASNITMPVILVHNGGRRRGLELGCQELRSKRYISDGLCTTPRPINEVVCADWCIMPPGQQPGQLSPTYQAKINWKEWTTRQKQMKSNPITTSSMLDSNYPANSTVTTLGPEKWRCVDGAAKKRRVKLICKDGSRRIYHVKVVKRCKCTKKHEHRRRDGSSIKQKQDKRKKTRRLASEDDSNA